MRKPLRLLLPTAAISLVLLSLLSSHHTPLHRHLQLSSSLASRTPWRDDEFCKRFNISYLQPKSGDICPLASFPGSGSTWVRYLIEGATGVFTGSIYKDLQLQMTGFWGEIRDWRDGTTVVQKTHDGEAQYIRSVKCWELFFVLIPVLCSREVFHGRGILILRNPYEAVLSKLNFLYGGHRGSSSISHYRRLCIKRGL